MGAEGHVRSSPGCDPWRRRMFKTAETLRRLDAGRFERQIARIEECLRVDAAWNLEAALASCRRTPVRWLGGPAAGGCGPSAR